jgi:hypothetical protein
MHGRSRGSSCAYEYYQLPLGAYAKVHDWTPKAEVDEEHDGVDKRQAEVNHRAERHECTMGLRGQTKRPNDWMEHGRR